MGNDSGSATGDNYSPRSGTYGIVPREIAEDSNLGKGALRTYIALRCFTNKAGKAWPTVKTLAAVLHADRRNVQRWLRELEQAGHIRSEAHIREKVGGYGSNTYTALDLTAALESTAWADESAAPLAVAPTAPHALESTAPHALKSTAPLAVAPTAQTDKLNGSSEREAFERSSITTPSDAAKSTASLGGNAWIPVVKELQKRYEEDDAISLRNVLMKTRLDPTDLEGCLDFAERLFRSEPKPPESRGG